MIGQFEFTIAPEARCLRHARALSSFNIQSSFTVQNPRAQLVKIEHVILRYLTSANSDSALLTIKHKNCALLTMASADRFAEIVEEQIPEIMNEPDTINTKTKQNTFATTSGFVDFRNARFENCKFAFTYNCQRKAIDLL